MYVPSDVRLVVRVEKGHPRRKTNADDYRFLSRAIRLRLPSKGSPVGMRGDIGHGSSSVMR